MFVKHPCMWHILLFLFSPTFAAEYELTFFNVCTTHSLITLDVKFSQTLPQKLNVTFNIPYDIDTGFSVAYKVFSTSTPGDPVKLAEGVDKRGACKFLNRYVGLLWFDIQSRAGLQPIGCPILKGQYNVVNYIPNFGSLEKYNLSLEKITINMQWKDKRTDVVRFCTLVGINIR